MCVTAHVCVLFFYCAFLFVRAYVEVGHTHVYAAAKRRRVRSCSCPSHVFDGCVCLPPSLNPAIVLNTMWLRQNDTSRCGFDKTTHHDVAWSQRHIATWLRHNDTSWHGFDNTTHHDVVSTINAMASTIRHITMWLRQLTTHHNVASTKQHITMCLRQNDTSRCGFDRFDNKRHGLTI